MRKTCGVVLAAVLAALVLASPASAAKPTGGSFTTTLTVAPTLIGTTTVSGTVTANVTQFKLDQNGHLVAIATLSGQLTATDPLLGTGTIDVTGTRVVLNAQVTADCSGHLHIDLEAVLQLNLTVTLTSSTGTTTLTLSATLAVQASLDVTFQTPQQQSLICDISTLLGNGASLQAVVDKLNTLLRTL
jgi:hypothetical protein